MVVWLVFGQGKRAARMEVVEAGVIDNMVDEDVGVGRAAFTWQALKEEGTDDAEEVDTFA